jgi:glycosyltransferase involved in cell wall biosynthesis
MYRDLKVTAIISALNEEKLVGKTIDTLPASVDAIIVTNDGSTDATLSVLERMAAGDPRITIIDNQSTLGLGASLRNAYRRFLLSDSDLVCVLPGDAQHDPDAIPGMFDVLLDEHLDYVKPNRFIDMDALKQMPRYRRIGNIVITILTKFATGYYSIFDSQNGSGVFRRSTLANLSLNLIGDGYDYENTLLVALSIIGAKVKDYPVKAIYGDEESTIRVVPTALRALKVTFTGFWTRIWYKYIVYNFHPIALFLLSGLMLFFVGCAFCLYMLIERIAVGASPSTGTVMLGVLPLILSFQLVLTAILMDVNNESQSGTDLSRV